MSSGSHGLSRGFKHFGSSGQEEIDIKIFRYGCSMVGLVIDEEDSLSLFNSYDADSGGTLDFHEFVKGVMGDAHLTHGADSAGRYSRYIRSSDFKAGERIQFMFPRTGHSSLAFEIIDADGFTKKMGREHPELFPQSNVQAIANLMPARLAEIGVKVKRVFKELDTAGRGYITPAQFEMQLGLWAVELGFVDQSGLTDEESKHLVRHYNVNDDDRIDVNEFSEAFALGTEFQSVHGERVKSVEAKIHDFIGPDNPAQLAQTFRSMDRDGNGRVTFNEFKTFLENHGCRLNDAEKAHVMCTYDADGDGCIDYEELSAMALRSPSVKKQMTDKQFSLLQDDQMTECKATPPPHHNNRLLCSVRHMCAAMSLILVGLNVFADPPLPPTYYSYYFRH